VEFGFPGPRILRFNEADWSDIVAVANPLSMDEIEFAPKDEGTCRILQKAVDLGYLVPHELSACRLPQLQGKGEK